MKPPVPVAVKVQCLGSLDQFPRAKTRPATDAEFPEPPI